MKKESSSARASLEGSTSSPSDVGEKRSTAKTRSRRRRWSRRFLWIFAILIAICITLRVILWASLPWFLSQAMERYGLQYTYERLNLSLLTGDAELWHIELRPSETEEPLAHVEYCRADVSLVTLLARRLVVRRVEIDGMDVSVIRQPDGTFPQFQQLLRSLPTRKSGTSGPDAETKPESVLRDEIDLTPPVKLDALRLQHVQVAFRDESVSPVLKSRLDVNVRLSDLGYEKRDTRFQAILSSPPVLDQLVVEGTGSSSGMDLIADAKIVLNGLHLRPLKDYLATFGISPDADSLSLACSGQIRTRGIENILKSELGSSQGLEIKATQSETPSVPRALNVHFDMNDVVLSADGLENIALGRLAIDANLPQYGTVDFSKIELVEGRVHAWRRANEVLSVAGLQFTGRPEARNTLEEQLHTAAGSSVTVERARPVSTNTPMKWSASNLSLRDLQLVLHDESVSPNADVALQVKIVAVEDIGPQDSQLGELHLLAEIGMPGVIETVHLEGSAKPLSVEKTAALRVSATGIRPDALAPYLETLGLESLHKDGELACNVDVVFTPQDDGRIGGEVSITDILLEDESELFGLKAISLRGVQFDPNSGTTRIEDISISGQSLVPSESLMKGMRASL